MDGYIGGRAKRRRRNTIIFIVSFFVICFLIYVIPSFQLNETAPPDSLLPSEEEILTPAINSTIDAITPIEWDTGFFVEVFSPVS